MEPVPANELRPTPLSEPASAKPPRTFTKPASDAGLPADVLRIVAKKVPAADVAALSVTNQQAYLALHEDPRFPAVRAFQAQLQPRLKPDGSIALPVSVFKHVDHLRSAVPRFSTKQKRALAAATVRKGQIYRDGYFANKETRDRRFLKAFGATRALTEILEPAERRGLLRRALGIAAPKLRNDAIGIMAQFQPPLTPSEKAQVAKRVSFATDSAPSEGYYSLAHRVMNVQSERTLTMQLKTLLREVELGKETSEKDTRFSAVAPWLPQTSLQTQMAAVGVLKRVLRTDLPQNLRYSPLLENILIMRGLRGVYRIYMQLDAPVRHEIDEMLRHVKADGNWVNATYAEGMAGFFPHLPDDLKRDLLGTLLRGQVADPQRSCTLGKFAEHLPVFEPEELHELATATLPSMMQAYQAQVLSSANERFDLFTDADKARVFDMTLALPDSSEKAAALGGLAGHAKLLDATQQHALVNSCGSLSNAADTRRAFSGFEHNFVELEPQTRAAIVTSILDLEDAHSRTFCLDVLAPHVDNIDVLGAEQCERIKSAVLAVEPSTDLERLQLSTLVLPLLDSADAATKAGIAEMLKGTYDNEMWLSAYALIGDALYAPHTSPTPPATVIG